MPAKPAAYREGLQAAELTADQLGQFVQQRNACLGRSSLNRDAGIRGCIDSRSGHLNFPFAIGMNESVNWLKI